MTILIAKAELQDLELAHQREIEKLKEQKIESEEKIKEKLSKTIRERDTFKQVIPHNKPIDDE